MAPFFFCDEDDEGRDHTVVIGDLFPEAKDIGGSPRVDITRTVIPKRGFNPELPFCVVCGEIVPSRHFACPTCLKIRGAKIIFGDNKGLEQNLQKEERPPDGTILSPTTHEDLLVFLMTDEKDNKNNDCADCENCGECETENW
ncbi:MAG: hypothetical protein WC310_05090 [Patescibacteria group bacterium]|jgi:hypothetical protein